ncbi:hypothetical protein PIB30_077247 [Stylosanthes scabra]|uniref:Uncharacterized protein n=1 Tax=Stylosanthes scabra TaxID=79078 RepID=A0ABU6SRB5_9FABA|nr:hypothetical protein [Stylosanthes scabra]
MSRFGVATTFAHRELYLDSFRVVIGLREDNRCMGSGIIYYEIERRENLLRRASPTPQYSPLSPVIRNGSPSLPSKMVLPTQGCQGQEWVRPLKSWELIPPSECWMCGGDKVEGKKASESVSARIEEEGKNEEEVEEEEEKDPEEDPFEEEIPVIPRPMDMDADEDYLQYLEEL